MASSSPTRSWLGPVLAAGGAALGTVLVTEALAPVFRNKGKAGEDCKVSADCEYGLGCKDAKCTKRHPTPA